MIGVFVRKPYARKIVSGEKIIETRTRNTLRRLIGEHVAIVETGNGCSKVVGYATIGHPAFLNGELWEQIRDAACILKGSKYDNNGNGKWCYPMMLAKECAQYPLPPNAIRHGRVWCEFDI